jgi:hypothetical protein
MTKTTAIKQSATPIDETAELGFGAILVAEGEGGGYEPIGIVSTVREARQIADEDLEIRMEDITKGAEPMYPAHYAVWTRSDRGAYRVIATFEAD